MESAKIDLSESSIAGIECTNYNRFALSTCSIEQSKSFTTTTTMSTQISDEFSRASSSEFTIGTSRSSSASTSLAKSTSSTKSTTNELSLGTDIENEISSSATAGTNDIVVAQGTVTSKLSIKTSQQFTESSTESKTNGKSTTDGKSITNGKSGTIGITETIGQTETEGSSSTNTDGLSKTKTGGLSETESYESTEQESVVCQAEATIIPSHSVETTLVFTTSSTTVNTFTDMKLTLCSAFKEPENPNNDDHIILLRDIPGTIGQTKTTQCKVQFAPAKYLPNSHTCREEQNLVLTGQVPFVPNCQDDDPDLYEPCQCSAVYTLERTVCYCVDQFGDKNGDMRT